MPVTDPIRQLQSFLDAKWRAVRPAGFPAATDGWRLIPYGSVPPLAEAVTAAEAGWFLASVIPHGSEPPLLVISRQQQGGVRQESHSGRG